MSDTFATIDGATAKEGGMAIDAVEPADLDATINALLERIADVPRRTKTWGWRRRR